MCAKKRREYPHIRCENGETYLNCKGLYAEYRQPFWLFKVNDIFLLPGLRRNSCRTISVNNKRYGKAYFLEGCIPLPPYISEDPSPLSWVFNRVRVRLGLFCRRGWRGYFYVHLGRNKFAVTRRVTKEKLIYGKVYYYMTGEIMGTYIFNEDFTAVRLATVEGGLPNTLKVIAGYIADVSIYSTLTDCLNRKIEITASGP